MTGAAALIRALREDGGLAPREIEREAQARMSDHAGFICTREGVRLRRPDQAAKAT